MLDNKDKLTNPRNESIVIIDGKKKHVVTVKDNNDNIVFMNIFSTKKE